MTPNRDDFNDFDSESDFDSTTPRPPCRCGTPGVYCPACGTYEPQDPEARPPACRPAGGRHVIRKSLSKF